MPADVSRLFPPPQTTVDRDLKRIVSLEQATQDSGQRFVKIGLGGLFLVAVWIFSALLSGAIEGNTYIIAAAIIGGYMALNIGANDVANNVGPAVGSKALTLLGALLIAAVFESAGAILAGGDVVSTIKKGIIDPSLMPDSRTFIWTMMSALLAAALWLNLATYLGAPVSTTHSIVGGVMGAGIAATGFAAVNWPTMAKIAASWVISPVMGGVIAALFLFFIKTAVLNKEDKLTAARRWVPVVVAIMASAFSVYLVMKGFKKLWKADLTAIVIIGIVSFAAAYAIVRSWVGRRVRGLENRRKSVNTLFVVPLVCSAALLSFAHGANDVANAIGPLAAIVSAVSSGEIVAKAGIPLWVMAVGAAGISAGLFLFGPKLIRTVGQQITKLNPVRAFCVALAAAITVIIASALGLPVSSTHIAVGGVFGVGFLREFLDSRRRQGSLSHWPKASGIRWQDNTDKSADELAAETRDQLQKEFRKSKKRKLVRRSHLLTIVAAWVVTVPAAALLAAILFLVFTGLGPKLSVALFG
ncbi:MAG: inorganic phosphate transporter [Rhodospirillales bacterium]|nr:inorganic phosphate transporter [Rhodospirillales bacterium]